MAFLRSVKVGDVTCCRTDATRLGRTQLALLIEVWALRQRRGDLIKVTSAESALGAPDGAGDAG